MKEEGGLDPSVIVNSLFVQKTGIVVNCGNAFISVLVQVQKIYGNGRYDYTPLSPDENQILIFSALQIFSVNAPLRVFVNVIFIRRFAKVI